MKKDIIFLLKSISLVIILFLIFSLEAIGQKGSETAKLLPSDGQSGAFFGNAVATNGEIAVVGAWFDNEMAGAAYVFRRTGDNWEEEEKLISDDGSSYDFFGCSVAINGNDVIVGASGWSNKGASYIFHFNGTGWIQTDKLIAANGLTYDNFGTSVTISDDYVVVGADGAQTLKGAAYVFKKNGTSWQEEEMLTGPLYATSFGSAVDISDETIFIGANGSSYAYVFMLDGNTWVNVAELQDINGSIYDKYGCTVSVDGDLAVVGATHHQNGNGATGAAYIYHRQGSNWVEEAKIVADDGELDDHFGIVSLFGNTVVIGAYDDDDYGMNAGAAYIYKKEGNEWQFKNKLLASDGFAQDKLGSSVSIFSDIIVAGAPDDNDNGPTSGSAYVFAVDDQTGIPLQPENRVDEYANIFPNPFSTETTIEYNVFKNTVVSLQIFDCNGKPIKTLVNNYSLKGTYQIKWNGTNNSGAFTSKGIYYFKYKTENKTFIKKIIKF